MGYRSQSLGVYDTRQCALRPMDTLRGAQLNPNLGEKILILPAVLLVSSPGPRTFCALHGARLGPLYSDLSLIHHSSLYSKEIVGSDTDTQPTMKC
jgi:hypothetical protein